MAVLGGMEGIGEGNGRIEERNLVQLVVWLVVFFKKSLNRMITFFIKTLAFQLLIMLPVVTYNVVTYIVENTYIAVAYKRSRLPTHSNQQ